MREGKFSTAIFRRVLETTAIALLCGIVGIAALLSGNRTFTVLSFVLAGSCALLYGLLPIILL